MIRVENANYVCFLAKKSGEVEARRGEARGAHRVCVFSPRLLPHRWKRSHIDGAAR